jgi:hypothetical protein
MGLGAERLRQRALGLPHRRILKYAGLRCHQPGYGLGRTVETWFATGVAATSPQ